MSSIPAGFCYIDTSVLLNYLSGYGRSRDRRATKAFFQQIAQGTATGIVSTWALMEMISVIRKACVRKNYTNYGVIEQDVVQGVGKIMALKNLEFVSGTQFELSILGRNAPLVWAVLELGLDQLRNSNYRVAMRGSNQKLVGIGGNDAFHISLACYFGCDYLATFDKGFWSDTHPIKIYDVKANKMRG